MQLLLAQAAALPCGGTKYGCGACDKLELHVAGHRVPECSCCSTAVDRILTGTLHAAGPPSCKQEAKRT